MNEKLMGTCNSCESIFPLNEITQGLMTCPICKKRSVCFLVVCPHCNNATVATNVNLFQTHLCPFPDCNKEFFWETVKTMSGKDVDIRELFELDSYTRLSVDNDYDTHEYEVDLDEGEDVEEDLWVIEAFELAENFYGFHRKHLPEDPQDVWKMTEVCYFFLILVLWTAHQKFNSNNRQRMEKRADEFRNDVYSSLSGSTTFGEDKEETFSYDAFLSREAEYFSKLTKGSRSLFKVVSLSVLKPACKAFLNNACKRYIFSERDLTKFVNHYVTECYVKLNDKIELT